MIIITIKTENAAFADDEKAVEVSRILRELAAAIARNDRCAEYVLRDINGNKVGSVSETSDD